MNVCVSYTATIKLVETPSKLHTVPLHQWIEEGVTFKFWGDNIDKQQHVRDLQSEHHGKMLHMFTVLVGCTRTPSPTFSFTGQLDQFTNISPDYFLPASQIRCSEEKPSCPCW